MYRTLLTQLDDSLILDDDKCIDQLAHRADTRHSLLKAVHTLINRRCGKYGYNRDIERVEHLSNHRRSTRTCSTTHTRSEEDKVGVAALDILANLRQRLLCLILTRRSIITRTLTIAHTYLL